MEANQTGASYTESSPEVIDGILAIMGKAQETPKEEKPQEQATPDGEEPAQEAPPKEEAKAEPASETVEIDPEEKLFEVEETLEGGRKEVRKYSLNELKAQRMMQADYQRKTAELARQREETQVQVRQAVEAEKKQYMEALKQQQTLLMNVVAPDLQKVDMDQLAQDDPAEYVRVQNRINKFNQALQWTQAEQQRLIQQEQDHIQKVLLPKAAEELSRDIPNWGPEIQRSISKTAAEKYGFTPEELNSVIDPRMVKVLHDAYQLHQIRSQKPIAEKKVVEKPKVMKSGTPTQVAERGEEFKRLQKSGRVEDAASAIRRML